MVQDNRDGNAQVEQEVLVRKIRELKEALNNAERKRRRKKATSTVLTFELDAEDSDEEEQSDASEAETTKMAGVVETLGDEGGFSSAREEPWQLVATKGKKRVPPPRTTSIR